MRPTSNAGSATALATTWRERSELYLYGAVAFAFVYYCILITNGSLDLLYSKDRNLVSGVVFNSMLSHLLRGEFTVDPEAIRQEAFVRDGKTYSYFGIAPVLLRLPLLPFKNFATLDITALSIVIAASVSAYFKCASLLVIKRLGHANTTMTALYGLLVLGVLVGGPQVQFLKASIYQEVICWAMALSAAFIYCVIRGLFLPSGFSRAVLAPMAALAGIALLTRVTAGIALYAALFLLLASLASRECSFAFFGRGSARPGGDMGPSMLQWLISSRVLLPLVILIGFASLCGMVNYGRWGNPLVFADVHLNPVAGKTGVFNLLRLPFAVLYYFLPLSFLRGPDGAFLLADYRWAYFDGMELPPSSFLITDPATLILAGTFIVALTRRWNAEGLDLRHAGAVLIGLSLAVFLILTYYFLAFRFRGEFYPLLEFAALLGFYFVTRSSDSVMPNATWRFEKALTYSVVVGIFTSHAMLGAYKVSPFQSERFIESGWVKPYSATITYWRGTLKDI